MEQWPCFLSFSVEFCVQKASSFFYIYSFFFLKNILSPVGGGKELPVKKGYH